MLWTSLWRVLKMSLTSMWRNGWLTITAISVMFLVFLTMNVFIIFGTSFNSAIQSIGDKVDFTIFFKSDAPEDQILQFRDTLTHNALVKDTAYTSKEQALEIYDQQKPGTKATLQDYGNPFSASLDIKTSTPASLDSVAHSVENNPLVKKIKYSKQTVDAINRGTQLLQQVGMTLLVFLAIIAFLVVLNTVRLAIYTRRHEIEIMQLVGATDWFVRGPFIIEAVYDGAIAAILSTVVLYFVFAHFSTQLIDLSYLFKIPKPDFGLFAAIRSGLYQIVLGAALGAVSAWVAIRQHIGK